MPDSGKLDSSFSTLFLGDFPLKDGGVLQSAKIAYKLLGPPDAPVIIYPTWFSGLISHNFYLLEPSEVAGPALSIETYRILILALFGNGQSTSPSNSEQHPFPAITIADNVNAQEMLLSHLKIDKIYAAIGWSMGGMTALQWGSQFPKYFSEDSPGIIAICATAKCSVHNSVFLEGVKSTLLAGAVGLGSEGVGIMNLGICTNKELMVNLKKSRAALRAMARVYAGWGFSQAFYREERFKDLGYKDLEDWFVRFWESWAISKNVEDLLCMLQTWQTGDIGSCHDISLYDALKDFKVQTLYLPGEMDLYFHPWDANVESKIMPKGKSLHIPGVYGHWAGGPGGCPEDIKWIGEKIKEFFSGAVM